MSDSPENHDYTMLRVAANTLDMVLNEESLRIGGRDNKYGFILLLFPRDNPTGAEFLSTIKNSVAVKVLKNTARRLQSKNQKMIKLETTKSR